MIGLFLVSLFLNFAFIPVKSFLLSLVSPVFKRANIYLFEITLITSVLFIIFVLFPPSFVRV